MIRTNTSVPEPRPVGASRADAAVAEAERQLQMERSPQYKAIAAFLDDLSCRGLRITGDVGAPIEHDKIIALHFGIDTDLANEGRDLILQNQP